MMQLPHRDLPEAASDRLKEWQLEIDRIDLYSQRVETGKTRFASRNKPRNPTFKVVRQSLSDMCSGARRCSYCEDSAANEIEHVKPKDLYPEFVFVWENYVYACGTCNNPKSGKFAVFASTTGIFTDVTRPRPNSNNSITIEPPEAGEPVLIDPRTEDPLIFLQVDLLGTFEIISTWGLDERRRKRAEYTIDLLGLNRDLLLAARQEAFDAYKARLYEYADRKAKGENVESLLKALKNTQHPTVWKEMQRQQLRIPDLKQLFDMAPEALDW